MQALTIIKPNFAKIEEIEKPKPLALEVLIKVMATGICGTDIHIFRGEYIGDYPVIPGHEFSGVIEEKGEKVTRFKEGDRVAVEPNIWCDNCYNCLNNRQNYCLNWEAIGVTKPGAMAQYVLAPEKNVFNIGNVPFEIGAFVEPLSCVIHGLEKVEISLSDKIAIVGAGPIGILMLETIKIMGASEVTVVEKNKERATFAEKKGADTVLSSIQELNHDYYDVVIDATGAISVMENTLNFVRYGGSILLFGVPPSGYTMEIEPFKIFRKGLKIVSSYTSLRNSYQAVEILKRGMIDIGDLVSHRLRLDDFQKGIELIEKGSENVLKVMIIPNGCS